MKKLFSIFFLIMFLFSCENQNKFNASLNEEVPNFELEDSDGNSYELNDDKGKVVVIYVFGSSCPICIAAGPSIQSDLFKTLEGNENFNMIGIDQWNGNKSAIRGFESKTGITFNLLAKGADVAASLNSTFDRLLVIDQNSILRFKGSQVAKNDIDKVINIVNELLNE